MTIRSNWRDLDDMEEPTLFAARGPRLFDPRVSGSRPSRPIASHHLGIEDCAIKNSSNLQQTWSFADELQIESDAQCAFLALFVRVWLAKVCPNMMLLMLSGSDVGLSQSILDREV